MCIRDSLNTASLEGPAKISVGVACAVLALKTVAWRVTDSVCAAHIVATTG